MNPWQINSIYELQYFNCPVCVFKDRSKQEFIDHAVNLHPESATEFSNISDGSLLDIEWPFQEIKEECFEEYPLNCDSDISSSNQNEKFEITEKSSFDDCFVALENKDFVFCELCCQYFTSRKSFKLGDN